MTGVDILIVGAGPTGLTLALELAAQTPPPSFRIIEATTTRSDKSRALVLHPRTLELLSRHGSSLIQTLLEKGKFNDAIRIFANKKFVYEIDLQGLNFSDTQFGKPLMISQAETEAVLEESLGMYGVVVERGITASHVSQDEDGVTAILKRVDGEGEEEEMRFKYIVGCDGAHSVVRKSADMSFEGGVYPQDFILADVPLTWEQKPCLSIFLGQGFMAVFPLTNNLYRLIVSRPGQNNNDVEPTSKDFEEVMETLVPGKVELGESVWMTRFRLHHRIVDKYRKGRCFVAGDAAHIHSPAGGQGMNTGMQDSINLAWKLSAVLRAEEDDAFLDTYDVERRKVGVYLLNGTDRLFEMMATTNPMWLWIRNTLVQWLLPWVMMNRNTRQNRFRFVSQLGIRYRNSPIVGQSSTWKGALRGGDRAPDGELKGAGGEEWLLELCRGANYHLLLFSGIGEVVMSKSKLQEAAIDLVAPGDVSLTVHELFSTSSAEGSENLDPEGKFHALYGFKEAGYVLVRPDGYISFIGLLSAVDELKAWLRK